MRSIIDCVLKWTFFTLNDALFISLSLPVKLWTHNNSYPKQTGVSCSSGGKGLDFCSYFLNTVSNKQSSTYLFHVSFHSMVLKHTDKLHVSCLLNSWNCFFMTNSPFLILSQKSPTFMDLRYLREYFAGHSSYTSKLILNPHRAYLIS
jgi:hypothetical protein